MFFFLVAEFLGEKLAAFFGITTPRYQYVIDEFYRLKEQVFHIGNYHWLLATLHSSAIQLFVFQEREEEEAEKREREYVEQMVAERLASLEGGDTLSLKQNLDFMMNGKPQEQNVDSIENKL